MAEDQTPQRKFPFRTAVLILLLLGTGIFFYFHTAKKLAGGKAAHRDELNSASSLRINNLSYVQTEGERLSLKIRADSAEYRDNPRVATLENIRAQVYPKSGSEISIYSGTGEYDLDREILSLPGDVTATTGDGLKIGAGQGSYNHKLKEMVFESFLTVTGPNLYVQGNRLKVDTGSGRLTIENGIEADLAPARLRTLLKIKNPGEKPGR